MLQKLHHRTVQKQEEEEIHRKKIILSELRHKIIDDLRLKKETYWWSKINIII